MKKVILLTLSFCLLSSVTHASRFQLQVHPKYATPFLVDTEKGIVYTLTETDKGSRWLPLQFNVPADKLEIYDGVTASKLWLKQQQDPLGILERDQKSPKK